VNFGPQTKNVWAQILTHRKCLYTVSWPKSIRHVVLGYSFGVVCSHCCEKNFEYLNWLCTRTCGAGRPYVWLCHAHLVIIIRPIIVVFASDISEVSLSPVIVLYIGHMPLGKSQSVVSVRMPQANHVSRIVLETKLSFTVVCVGSRSHSQWRREGICRPGQTSMLPPLTQWRI